MEMIVNTVRMVDNDQTKEYSFGDNSSLKDKLAIGFINPQDFNSLNISSNLNLRLDNKFGSVVIKPLEEEDVPKGIIIMPVSIWANQITGIERKELVYKNIGVNVEVTSESILEIQELLNLIKD